jgi:hypothetical protein
MQFVDLSYDIDIGPSWGRGRGGKGGRPKKSKLLHDATLAMGL